MTAPRLTIKELCLPAAPAMGRDLDGSVALISGGGRGLGRVLARTLAARGAAVALIARSGDQLSATVAEITAAGGAAAAAPADIADPEATASALKELQAQRGRPDLLINNAGIHGPIAPLWETEHAEWWRTIEVNLGGAYTLTRAVLPEMIAAGRGRIINITSHAGVYRWPLNSAYAASKAALVKLTETLAVETRRHGISVFSVDPGLLPIGLSADAIQDAAGTNTPEDRVFAWVRNRIANGHGADPAQAAELVAQIAAGRGDRLSGRHLTVDDDLDSLLARIDDIKHRDLHTLRLRTAGESHPPETPLRPAPFSRPGPVKSQDVV